jgi:hypothetical protein
MPKQQGECTHLAFEKAAKSAIDLMDSHANWQRAMTDP